jgi:hypothetical protein
MPSSESDHSPQPLSERLDSWKEIAAYLQRGARTVQRWEKTERLPVHRHMHDKLGSVYAYKAEIDAWSEQRRQRLQGDMPAPPTRADPALPHVSPGNRTLPRSALAIMLGLIVVIAATWRLSVRARVADARRIMPFTTLPGFEHAPVFSPDGTKVAFVWKGPNTDELDIFYKAVGGGEPVRLTENRAYNHAPSWSPDGKHCVHPFGQGQSAGDRHQISQ